MNTQISQPTPLTQTPIPFPSTLQQIKEQSPNIQEDNVCASTYHSNQSQDKSNLIQISCSIRPDQKDNRSEQLPSSPLEHTLHLERKQSLDFQHKSKKTNFKNHKKQVCKEGKNIEVKCGNKQCLAKGVEKVRSKITNRSLWLCLSCFKNYKFEHFCEYCQQIYSKEEINTLEWIQCENKDCKRWNHKTCQNNTSTDVFYLCSQCKVLNLNTEKNHEIPEQEVEKNPVVQQLSTLSTEITIFKPTKQSFTFLQSMLNGCNYKLSFTEQQLRKDSLCSLNLQQSIPDIESKDKRKKYKKKLV